MTEIDRLCREVCDANRALESSGLVTLTWGNASGLTADRRVMAIKPSGVPYSQLTPDLVAVIDLADGAQRSGLRPSTDTATHAELYRAFPQIQPIVHTHSCYATIFAQLRREIPCLGTSHADHYAGSIPVTRQLSPAELVEYERSTGRLIVERFQSLDPVAIPGVLVAGHAPFTWGPSVAKALENAIALEAIARIAQGAYSLTPDPPSLEAHVMNKHHDRKHGPHRYYGQP